MNWNEYQDFTDTTAIYPDADEDLVYPILGLNGEAGEIAEKLKKIIRDGNYVITEEKCEEMIKELGDVLWYTARIARALDCTLEEVMEKNVEKLSKRKKENKLHGSGDNR